MATGIHEHCPETEAPQIIQSPGTIRERGALRRLGHGSRLMAALLIILAVPQLTAKIAVNFSPWLASVDPENAFAWLSIHHLTQIAITLLLMAFWSRGSLRAWGLNFNQAKVSLRWFGWFALFCTLGMLVFGVLPMLYRHSLPQLSFALNGRNVIGSLGFYYLLSGSGEEPLCRGFIMTMLLICWKGELRLGKVAMPVAGLWATLLFMLAHVNYTIFPFKITQFIWQQQVFCLGLGLYYAAAFYRTGSLLCPILAHGFSNGIVWSLIYVAIALTPVRPISQQTLGRVGLEPNPPVASQEVNISYQASGGPLGEAKQINLHYGFNGWQQAADKPMAGLGEERWQLRVKLPPARARLTSSLPMATAGIIITEWTGTCQ